MAAAREVRWRLVLDSKGFETSAKASHQAANTLVTGIGNASTAVGASASKFGLFADSVGKVSTTLARSAPAFGLPVGPLKALDDVADVAEIGLKNLTTTAVGFNAASVGVAGAGLAVGAALGTWLNTFPQVRAAVDQLTESVIRLATGVDLADARANATAGLSEWQAQMAASHEAAMKKQVETMRDAGFTMAQIIDVLDSKRETSTTRLIDNLRLEEAAVKKAAADQKKALEDLARAAQHEQDVMARVGSINVVVGESFKVVRGEIESVTVVVDDATAALLRMEESGDFLDRFLAGRGHASLAEGFGELTDIFDALGGALDDLGVSADSALGELVTGLAGAAEGAANLAAGFASMNPAQIIAGIGGIAGAIKDLVSSESALNRFIGGALVLGPLGGLAGVLFGGSDGPMQTAYNLMSLIEEATDKTADAMERWGVTVDQMGPRFQQQHLHEALVEIFQDFQLLTASGADAAMLLEGPMGDAIQELVQQAQAAGVALPETLRPMIQQLIEMGQLTDAAGNAITDVSQLQFTETLEQGVARLIEQIERLVNALLGIPDVTANVNVNYHHNNPQSPVNPNLQLPPPDISAAEGFYSPSLPEDAFFQLHKGERVEVTPADETARRNNGWGNDGGAMPQVNVYIGPEKLDGIIQRRIDAGLIRVNA